MSITNVKVIEQVDAEIVLVIGDAIGGEIVDSIAEAKEYANRALEHSNTADEFAAEAAVYATLHSVCEILHRFRHRMIGNEVSASDWRPFMMVEMVRRYVWL